MLNHKQPLQQLECAACLICAFAAQQNVQNKATEKSHLTKMSIMTYINNCDVMQNQPKTTAACLASMGCHFPGIRKTNPIEPNPNPCFRIKIQEMSRFVTNTRDETNPMPPTGASNIVPIARRRVNYANHSPESFMKPTKQILAAFLLLVAAILTTGCATDAKVIAQASQTNSQLAPAIMSDPELASYLQQIGDRIIASAKQLDAKGFGPSSHKSGDNAWMFSGDMKFYFVNSKTVNAFTTGGKYMYVYNELFQMCHDEDELAAVMSHEYGHVYARHVAKGMNRQMELLIGGAVVGGAAGYAVGGKDNGANYAVAGAGVGAAGGQFLNMGFTRGDEAQADNLGFNFYCRAGWDPAKFAEFFQQMIDAGYDTTPAIASDHPTLASRVEVAKKEVKALPPDAAQWRKPPIADVAKFKELQARAQALSTKMPNDQSLASSQKLLQALPRSCIIPYTAKDEIEARQEIVAEQQAAADKKKK